MTNVTIFSTPSCVYCKMTKEFFQKNNVEYAEKNVATDIPAREEMLSKSGQMGVPVILVKKDAEESVIVGFDQRRLKELLEIE